MRTILPLTEYEKQLAEQCHDMVYIYLKKHYYDIEEYYDIAIMGLLAGVQQWNRSKEVKEKYSISTICSRNIHGAIATHLRDENRQKRKPSGGFISLDLQLEDSTESFINSIITPTLEDEFFEEYDRQEEADRIKDILSQLTDIQRKIVLLKADDKTNKEIAEKIQIPYQKINWELNRIRNLILSNKPQKIKINTNTHNKYLIKCLGAPVEVILCLSLSARQKEVFSLLIKGYRQIDIANSLNISKFAVNNAVRQIRKKAEKVR